MRVARTIRLKLALALLLLVVGVAPAAAQGITARARVTTQSVFVGQPVRLQIQISGSETPDKPDLSKLAGFRVKEAGGGSNSRRSVSIVNGRRTENVQLGYVFNYDLRATRQGRLMIPAITVTADGRTTRTQPLVINAQKPSETENYKLRVNLSRTTAYIGEQIVLEGIFYFSGEVAETQISIPAAEHEAFESFDLEQAQGANKVEQLEGKQFRTGRVRKVLVPLRAGNFVFEPATLSFRGQDGVETVRDFFGRQVRQAKFRNFVIPSNPLNLTIKPLPAAGRPVNFTGHVGEFSLNVQASPTEVNVGDPITLNIAVTGPALLEPVKLPGLHAQESLTADFKVPSEIEDGSINGNFKIFTQTVRALREDVSVIPPIELAYFDTAKGTYEVARSEAIPITVRATRIVTAGDAEGLGPVTGPKQEIQAWMQGIAHNYSGAEVLAKQVLGFTGLVSPGRLALIAVPPLAYSVLFGFVAMQRRRLANPEMIRARKALGAFSRNVAEADGTERILAVFRRFLGDKLSLSSEALTFRDVEAPLTEKGVAAGSLEEINNLFTAGEASRFAGGGGGEDVGELRDRVAGLVKELEKTLR